jgi:[acyl-carrier-protein] S-malonyltransferase
LRLVDTRGRLYDEGPDGMMAAIFPLPLEELEPYLERARHAGVIEIANRNSPSQHVIAGERPAVETAVAMIEEDEPGVQTAIVEKRIPMHTSLFSPVGAAFRPHLDGANWRAPGMPYVPNVTGTIVEAPEAKQIPEMLQRHVWNPVLWRESIDAIAARHPEACFVEAGPGAVLFNLLQKQWRRNPKMRTDDLADPAASLLHAISQLRHVC